MYKSLKTILILSSFLFSINNVVSQTKFAVIGDYGRHNTPERLVSDMIDSWSVDFVITVGDNNYGDLTFSGFDENVGRDYNQWMHPYTGNYSPGGSVNVNRFFPSIGNHDDGDDAAAYLDYFGPMLPLSASGNKKYYDFTWDNIHLFAINSQENFSSQENWLETQMDYCNTNHLHWKVVYFHKPPYSSGSHGNHEELQWDFNGMGAHAILSGHDHNYERLFIDEVYYFINGLGGTSIRDVGSPITGSEFIYTDDHGAQLVTVNDQEMTLEFHSLSDGLVDSKTIIDLLPVELAFFAAKLNENNVELSWRTETEINNYGFNIERRTDNSDWLSIGFVEGHGNSSSPIQYSFIDSDHFKSADYFYRLKQIDSDGKFEYSEVVVVTIDAPALYSLSQNYPNPFNPETRIKYTLPEQQNVSLIVYNMLGEMVVELVNELKPAGSYTVTFNGSSDEGELPSGIYIYKFQTDVFTEHKKLTLIR